MRLISGKWGGIKLGAPKGRGTRPTTDRNREALFSMLAARLDFDGLNVLDGFAGSGALGWRLYRAARRSACLLKMTKPLALPLKPISPLAVRKMMPL